MPEQKHREPTILDYAARETGRFAALAQGEPDLNARKAGLRLWAVVTLLSYLAAAMAIYVPLAILCFLSPGKANSADYVISAIAEWWFWLIVGVLLIAQALLLITPVRAAWDYQIKPRRLLLPLATTCTLLAILTGGILISGLVVVFGDDVPVLSFVGAGLVVVASWFVWWWVFRKYNRASPDRVITGTQKTLLRGSIVELLVAVSCHIWVRQRGDCSAPVFTYVAICAGVAILFCAFGPGVFYLFIAQARRMRTKGKRDVAAG